MNNITGILHHSISAPFYRRNAGFFLFAFFILFGLQPNFKQTLEFHYEVLNGISSSLIFFLAAVAIWFFYALKAIHFFAGCVKTKAYSFLQNMNAIPASNRLFQLFSLATVLLLPVLVYGLLAFIIGLSNNHNTGAIAVLFTLFLITALVTCVFYILLKTGSRSLLRIPSLGLHLPTNLFSLVLKYIFAEQFILLLILKIITFSGLYFFAKTDAQIFEDRMLWLIYLTSLVAHSILIYRNHQFIETKMRFYRNMPVKMIVKVLYLLGVYTIILLPEIWALKGLAIEQHAFANYIWMVLTGPAFLLLLHCLLYTEDMKMESFLQLLFGVWIVSLFFSLSANRWMLPLVCGVTAALIFFNSYYRYEKNVEIEGLE